MQSYLQLSPMTRKPNSFMDKLYADSCNIAMCMFFPTGLFTILEIKALTTLNNMVNLFFCFLLFIKTSLYTHIYCNIYTSIYICSRFYILFMHKTIKEERCEWREFRSRSSFYPLFPDQHFRSRWLYYFARVDRSMVFTHRRMTS